MTMFLRCLLIVVLPLMAVQDPTAPPIRSTESRPNRPVPPDGAQPLPPVVDPPRDSLDRRDLVQRFAPPSPLEGFYELSRVVRPGVPAQFQAQGYLVIGRRHLSLHIQGETVDPKRPHLQAGFRRYSISDGQIHMSTLIGHRNDDDGDILVEKTGLLESRQYLLVGSVLRIYQGKDNYLEFMRLE